MRSVLPWAAILSRRNIRAVKAKNVKIVQNRIFIDTSPLTGSQMPSIMFSMNRLSIADRAKILGMLVEGNSLRSCARMADVSLNTVTKLLVDFGASVRAIP